MFKKIGSDSHDLLDSPFLVSCNLAARLGVERIRARYHSLKLPRFNGFGERRLEGGGERWPQRQLSLRRFALAVNRTCMAEGEETGFPAIRTHSGVQIDQDMRKPLATWTLVLVSPTLALGGSSLVPVS